MNRLSTALVAAVVLSSSGVAKAEDLSTALSLEAEGRLGDALDAFVQALEQPGTTPEDLATIYLHLAVLRFGIGDQDGARHALHRLHALDHDAELPGSAPPELQNLFQQVKSIWGERRFDANIDAPTHIATGEEATVRLSVIHDVAGMVAGASLLSGGSVVAEVEGRGPSLTMVVPMTTLEPDGATFAARLLDEHGGILWQSEPFEIASSEGSVEDAEEDDDDDTVTPTGDAQPQRRGRPALRIAGWALLGTSLALAGVGGALVGIDGTVIETEQVAGRTRERVYTTGLAGWILIGTAGAGLAAAIALVVLGYRDPSPEALMLRLARGELARW